MPLSNLLCPGCGAELKPQPGDYRCDYCGGTFPRKTVETKAVQAPTARAQTPAPRRAPEAPPAPRPARRRGRLFARLFWFGALTAGAVALVRSGLFSVAVDHVEPLKKVPGLSKLAAATEHITWDHEGGPPALARSGGQDILVTRTRRPVPLDELFIDAYAPTTGKRLWRFEGLGRHRDAAASTHFAIFGERVLVTDAKARLHILDLKSGTSAKTVALTAPVTQLCVAPADAWAFIEQRDRRHHGLDAGTLSLRPAERPPSCERRARNAPDREEQTMRRALARQEKSLKFTRVYRDGEGGVAAAETSPGAPIPHAVGFHAPTMKIRWTTALPTIENASVRPGGFSWDAVADGRYTACYGEGQRGFRVVAVATDSGRRLWDVALRPLAGPDELHGLRITHAHVLVLRTNSIEVLDAGSGALLSTIGYETYAR